MLVGTLFLVACDGGRPDVPPGCELDPCACQPCIPPAPPLEVDTEPAWSPTGEAIAYTHLDYSASPNELYQIWALDVATRERRFVTPGSKPSWSPDGAHLVFERGTDIWRVELATGEEQRLTEWGGSFNPSWSPDGEWVAFDTSHDDPRGANVIWVMRADGTDKHDISEHGVGEWRAPSWSPDGEWLVHYRYPGVAQPEIFLMRADGSGAVRLTDDDRRDATPAFSPDGRRVAWASASSEGTADPSNGIWVMDADGSDKRQLTRRDGARATLALAPSWSPDGSRIVYSGYNEDSDTYTLWLAEADGRGDQPLTRPDEYEGLHDLHDNH